LREGIRIAALVAVWISLSPAAEVGAAEVTRDPVRVSEGFATVSGVTYGVGMGLFAGLFIGSAVESNKQMPSVMPIFVFHYPGAGVRMLATTLAEVSVGAARYASGGRLADGRSTTARAAIGALCQTLGATSSLVLFSVAIVSGTLWQIPTFIAGIALTTAGFVLLQVDAAEHRRAATTGASRRPREASAIVRLVPTPTWIGVCGAF